MYDHFESNNGLFKGHHCKSLFSLVSKLMLFSLKPINYKINREKVFLWYSRYQNAIKCSSQDLFFDSKSRIEHCLRKMDHGQKRPYWKAGLQLKEGTKISYADCFRKDRRVIPTSQIGSLVWSSCQEAHSEWRLQGLALASTDKRKSVVWRIWWRSWWKFCWRSYILTNRWKINLKIIIYQKLLQKVLGKKFKWKNKTFPIFLMSQ